MVMVHGMGQSSVNVSLAPRATWHPIYALSQPGGPDSQGRVGTLRWLGRGSYAPGALAMNVRYERHGATRADDPVGLSYARGARVIAQFRVRRSP